MNLLIPLSFAILICYIYIFIGIPSNIYFFYTNLVILALSYFGLFARKNFYYSLEKVVYFYIFFFFGFIPINDLIAANTYWLGPETSMTSKVLVNLLIIVGTLSFALGIKIRSILPKTKNINATRYQSINFFRFYLLIFSSCLAIAYVHDFNVYLILFRGLSSEFLPDAESYERLNKTLDLIFSNFIRPLPIILLISLYYFKKHEERTSRKTRTSSYTIAAFVALLAALIFVSPTSIARFKAAALYLPLLLLYVNYFNKPYLFQFALCFGFLILMPLLDKFRYFDPRSFDFSVNMDFLYSGHFDGYYNFTLAFENDFITYGEQLLGAVLFFIPRSIWDSKPVGSGSDLANTVNLGFNNISMPFIAEGYVNFGLAGVIIFMLILGVIVGQLDQRYWIANKTNGSNVVTAHYIILIGLLIFIMRGDLMSSFAYTVGTLSSVSFANFFISSSRNIKTSDNLKN